MKKKKTEYKKREYTVEKSVDILGCGTLLEEMGGEGRELVCTQRVEATVDGSHIILRIFKRPVN